MKQIIKQYRIITSDKQEIYINNNPEKETLSARLNALNLTKNTISSIVCVNCWYYNEETDERKQVKDFRPHLIF